MKVRNLKIEGVEDCYSDALFTVGKSPKALAKLDWLDGMIRAGHSPIRSIRISWDWVDIPYFSSVHFARHHVGVEHFVRTQRTDRTGIDRSQLSQSATVNHRVRCNLQSLINMSSKRLCSMADPTTREAMSMVAYTVHDSGFVGATIYKHLGPPCVGAGHSCPEPLGCGMAPNCWGSQRETMTRQRRAEISKFFENYRLQLSGLTGIEGPTPENQEDPNK